MRLLFLAILCIHGVLLYAEKPTHLKALVIFDASGSKLQKYYRLDGVRMEKNLFGIASQTGLTPEIQVLRANQLTQQKINSWIDTLSAKDVAVFYYAGKESYVFKGKWPSLIFSGGEKNSMLAQQELMKAIKRKNPRLTLFLVDCYNKVVRIPFKSFRIDSAVPPVRTSEDPGLVALFLKSSGVVSACSARRGKHGFAVYQNRPIGGLFTTLIQNYLYAKCATGIPFWYDMRCSLKFGCSGLSHKRQTPLMYEAIHNPSPGHGVRKSDGIKIN